jgi:hypothetical protein
MIGDIYQIYIILIQSGMYHGYIVMIEEQLSKDGSEWCNFHYVYKSDFDVVDEYKVR